MPDSKFDVGKMRHRVTLQIPDPPANRSNSTKGKPDTVWTTIGTYWARLEPLTGRELVNAKQIKPEISHRITMRVNGPLPTSGRLIFPGIEPTDDFGADFYSPGFFATETHTGDLASGGRFWSAYPPPVGVSHTFQPFLLDLSYYRLFNIVSVIREDETNGYYQVLTESTP